MFDFLKSDLWRYDGKFNIRKGTNVNTKFSAETQDDLFVIEDNSWWFNYRAKVIISMLERYFDKNKLLIDVGGGNGFTTSRAKQSGFSAALMEPSYNVCEHAYLRGIRNIFVGTMDDEGICDNSAEQVMMLDVLEHIEDDKRFIDTIFNKLKSGGVCLITVPAFMKLWSSEDVEAGHFRRYTKKELVSLVKRSGFEVLYSNYFMEFLFLPILIVRVWMEKAGLLKSRTKRTKEEQEKISKAQFEQKSGVVGAGLKFLESCELHRLKADKKVRFGSSVIVVIKKK